MTPNKRTVDLFKERGYFCVTVERWNSFARLRQDYLGVFDQLAHGPDRTHIGIQSTSNDHVADRVRKILASDAARRWLEFGNRIVVVGWAKMGTRGKRKTWQSKEVEVTLPMFEKV